MEYFFVDLVLSYRSSTNKRDLSTTCFVWFNFSFFFN